MSSFIGAIPKEVRGGINWLKKQKICCAYCQKKMAKFRYLWIYPHLNVLCGCPHYHFALNMICANCGEYKELAMGTGTNANNDHLQSYCPRCLS